MSRPLEIHELGQRTNMTLLTQIRLNQAQQAHIRDQRHHRLAVAVQPTDRLLEEGNFRSAAIESQRRHKLISAVRKCVLDNSIQKKIYQFFCF
jgi:hypothetical protein